MFDQLTRDEKEKLIKYSKWSGMVLLGSLFFLFLILIGMQDDLEDTEVIHNKPKTSVQAESESTFKGNTISLWTLLLVNIVLVATFISFKRNRSLKIGLFSLFFIIFTLLWALPQLFRDFSSVSDSLVQSSSVYGNSTTTMIEISSLTSSTSGSILFVFFMIGSVAVLTAMLMVFMRRITL